MSRPCDGAPCVHLRLGPCGCRYLVDSQLNINTWECSVKDSVAGHNWLMHAMCTCCQPGTALRWQQQGPRPNPDPTLPKMPRGASTGDHTPALLTMPPSLPAYSASSLRPAASMLSGLDVSTTSVARRSGWPVSLPSLAIASSPVRSVPGASMLHCLAKWRSSGQQSREHRVARGCLVIVRPRLEPPGCTSERLRRQGPRAVSSCM